MGGSNQLILFRSASRILRAALKSGAELESAAAVFIPSFLMRYLTRMFHELPSRDRKDGLATGQPQGVGPEAYLNGTSQGATPEDARKDAHIRGRSR